MDNKTSVGYGAFLTKINADETYGYTYQFAGSGSIRGLATDSFGNVYLTGTTAGTGVADFDPTSGTDLKSSTGLSFITKINANATYGWTHLFTGTGFYDGYGDGVAVQVRNQFRKRFAPRFSE